MAHCSVDCDKLCDTSFSRFLILKTTIAFECNVSLTLLVHALLTGYFRTLSIGVEQVCNGGS